MADTPSATAKWRARVSANPFGATTTTASSIIDMEDDRNHTAAAPTATTVREEKEEQDDDDDDSMQWRDSTAFFQDVAQQKRVPSIVTTSAGFGLGSPLATGHSGKENLAPSRRNIHIYERPGIATPPRMYAVHRSYVRPPRTPTTPSKRTDSIAAAISTTTPSSEPFSLLGKRPHAASSNVHTPHKQLTVNAYDDAIDTDPLADRNASPRIVTLDVTDGDTVPHLAFGRVAVSDRKTLQLELVNPGNALGSTARIKFDGCTPRSPARFKCDLHVCVVPAKSAVLLRITFAPLADDVDVDVHAVLRFTVNDRHRLACRVSGVGAARALKRPRFPSRSAAFARPAAAPDGVLAFAPPQRDAVEATSEATAAARRAETLAGLKRRESASLVLDMTPPRRPRIKRQRTGDATSSSAGPLTPRKAAAAAGGGVSSSSWWHERKVAADAHWMVKQERGFTTWMNYVLLDATTQSALDDAECDTANTNTVEDSGPARVKPPTTRRRRVDFSSLRVLAQKRIESAWTRAARELFLTPAIDNVTIALEREVASKKLACRTDRPVYADVGRQTELVELLNNYHPAWLCLGLETVLGARALRDERCSLRAMFAAAGRSRSRKMPHALKRVVLQHLVHDPLVAKRFRLVKRLKSPLDASVSADSSVSTGASMSAKPRVTGRDYFDALTDRFVVKFLLLIQFLDTAAAHRRHSFSHFPCLFRLASTASGTTGTAKPDDSTTNEERITRSQDVASAFCRLFLAGEGRFDKHLKALGVTLTHVQTPLDEVDLEITNLAVDLRDGVRLAKLMEALTPTQASSSTSTLSASQSASTLSSYLRVPALSRLQKVHNVEICLHYLEATCDIVDGHREKTLALLWSLVSCFQVETLVDTRALTREIATIEARMSHRARACLDAQQRNSRPSDYQEVNTDNHDVYALLLSWCRAVCANYNVPVRDFTTSFADGRALCYLVHYYHPMLLTKRDIQPTTQSQQPVTTDTDSLYPQLLANEMQHFRVVNSCVKQLGDVPVLLPTQLYCTSNIPDAKIVVTFVSYLQSRLMASSRELHAAARLKRWWQSAFVQTARRIARHRRARVIQRFWFTSSAKRLAIRQCRRLLRAAHTVKSVVRMWHARMQFCRLRDSVTALQRAFRLRQLQSRQTAAVCETAARTLQRAWRSVVAKRAAAVKREREAAKQRIAMRLKIKASAVAIEHWWLNVLQHRKEAAAWRAIVAQRVAAACALQRAWRQAQRRQFARAERQAMWKRQHASARIIQQQWRTFASRKALLWRVRVSLSAMKVTAAVRAFVLQRRYAHFVQLQRRESAAACCIQRNVRSAHQRKLYQQLQQRREVAALRIQRAFRCAIAAAAYRAVRAAAVCIQRNVRIWRRQQQLQLLITFYEYLLMYRDQQEELTMLQHAAAVCIQTAWRRAVCTQQYGIIQRAVCSLQRAVRTWRARARIAALRRAQEQLQATRHWAAVTIQCAVRAYTARQQRRYAVATTAAVRIQAAVRGWRSRRFECDWFAVKTQLSRLRVLVACWRIEACVAAWLARQRNQRQQEQQEITAATCIVLSWRAFKLRSAVSDRIASRREQLQRRLALEAAAEAARLEREREAAAAAAKAEAERIAREQAEAAAAAAKAEAERLELERIARAKAEAERLEVERAAAEAQRREEQRREQERLAAEAAAAAQAAAEEAKRMEREAAEAKRIEEALQLRRKQEVAAKAEAERLELERAAAVEVQRREQERLEQERLAKKAAEAAAAKAEAQRIEALRVCREQEKAAAAAAAKAETERLECERAAAAKQAAEAAAAAEAQRREQERFEQERVKQAAAQAAAAEAEARRLETERLQHERDELRRLETARRAAELRRRREQEAAAEALYQLEQREQQAAAAAAAAASVQRLQSWWRGTVVRRRHPVRPRKPTLSTKPTKPAAVRRPTTTSSSQPSTALIPSSTSSTSTTAVAEPPLTLGARLELALHLLLHGTRLPEMLFAAHTLEVCTKYSRECCRRCLKLNIPTTLFAAVRGLNRSRPHVELLHQLLLVLAHLTAYATWEQTTAPQLLRSTGTTNPTKSNVAVVDDVRAIEALVDVVTIHRDMAPIFALGTSVLTFYVREWRTHRAVFESLTQAANLWRDAERRLRGLYALLEKKAAVAAAVAKHVPQHRTASASSATNNRMDPEAAVAMLAQVLELAE